jgi:DNA-binding Lrp family transcriptional regulator
MADVGRIAPVPAEMPAVDQRIRAGHDPSVGSGDDRRVVAGTDQARFPLGQPLDQSIDDPELSCATQPDARGSTPVTCGSFNVVVHAYILIQTEVGKASDVAAEIEKIAGVVRVDAVTGPYDVVVLTESPNVDELGRMIVSKVQAVPGITRTLTCSVVKL